jgi:anti-anti-sigma regulatory factor
MLAASRIQEKEGVIILFLENNFNSQAIPFNDIIFKEIKLGYRKFIFEFSGIYWLHADVIGYLMAALEKITKNQGQLKLVRVPNNIKGVLEKIKLITHFEIYFTTGEAVESFKN